MSEYIYNYKKLFALPIEQLGLSARLTKILLTLLKDTKKTLEDVLLFGDIEVYEARGPEVTPFSKKSLGELQEFEEMVLEELDLRLWMDKESIQRLKDEIETIQLATQVDITDAEEK